MASKEYYTTAEVARMLHVYSTTVSNWIDSKKLKAYRTVGGHRRVRPDDLRAFVEQTGLPAPPELSPEPEIRSVLVVDDDPAVLRYLAKRLASPHLRVDTASSGFQGIYQMGLTKPDAVILDILMPGMDGVEVCEEIRSTAQLRHIRVIAITAHEDEKIRKRMLAAGADLVLAKPIDLKELVIELKQALNADGIAAAKT